MTSRPKLQESHSLWNGQSWDTRLRGTKSLQAIAARKKGSSNGDKGRGILEGYLLGSSSREGDGDWESIIDNGSNTSANPK